MKAACRSVACRIVQRTMAGEETLPMTVALVYVSAEIDAGTAYSRLPQKR